MFITFTKAYLRGRSWCRSRAKGIVERVSKNRMYTIHLKYSGFASNEVKRANGSVNNNNKTENTMLLLMMETLSVLNSFFSSVCCTKRK